MAVGSAVIEESTRLALDHTDTGPARVLREALVREVAANATLIGRVQDLEERLALFMRSPNEGLWDWDPISKVLSLSARLLEILGIDGGTLETSSEAWISLVHPDDRASMQNAVTAHLKGTTEIYECEYRVKARNGDWRWVKARGLALRKPEGVAYRMVGSIGDITEHKRSEAQIRYQASHDQLTGLPNRYRFAECLELAISQAGRSNGQVAVLFLDLDDFKLINDSISHQAGDRLLAEAAHRIETCVRSGDTVARMGGDEFTIVMPQVGSADAAARLAERVLAALRRPFRLDGQEVYVSTSIGVALSPGDGTTAAALLKSADAAMYRAKECGRARFHFYDRVVNQAVEARLAMISGLSKALDQGELSLRYQPKLDLRTGIATGAEALLRWNSPQLGEVSPSRFVPALEDTGLIVPIGSWVIEAGCAQLACWHRKNGPTTSLAVNLSMRQLRDPGLAGMVERLLNRYALPPEMLALEITESQVMRDIDVAMTTLHTLRDIGVRLHLDDFGTGYSSLSYLRRLPVSTIKIDRSFVHDLDRDAESLEIVKAIIAMGHALHHKVVAEGVETKRQRAMLEDLGCDEIQGYLFSPPVSADEAAAMMNGFVH